MFYPLYCCDSYNYLYGSLIKQSIMPKQVAMNFITIFLSIIVVVAVIGGIYDSNQNNRNLSTSYG